MKIHHGEVGAGRSSLDCRGASRRYQRQQLALVRKHVTLKSVTDKVMYKYIFVRPIGQRKMPVRGRKIN